MAQCGIQNILEMKLVENGEAFFMIHNVFESIVLMVVVEDIGSPGNVMQKAWAGVVAAIEHNRSRLTSITGPIFSGKLCGSGNTFF
ncbi:peroxisome biogenesis protein 2-like isoform X4 [Gossypium australe]|uniref:Peroxisome biogenesis protein 2-like isoform X4 n=1 Tax=Gossypium australe TaxID=47621 RepID=A0A5B6WCK4_9ROSI|nr:peroxisome biogenesis protein 2-like isoform X4 [Gossypium australe]